MLYLAIMDGDRDSGDIATVLLDACPMENVTER